MTEARLRLDQGTAAQDSARGTRDGALPAELAAYLGGGGGGGGEYDEDNPGAGRGTWPSRYA